MSLNAAALRLLAEKGLSALDIAEVAEAMEVRRDNTAAERQQRRRDKLKVNVETSRVTSWRDTPPIEDIIPPQIPQIAKAISTPSAEIADRVVEAWNEITAPTPLPQSRALTKDRLTLLKARLTEHTEADVIAAIRAMAASEWHSGKSGQWTLGNLTWLLTAKNFPKMLDRADSAKPTAPAKSPAEWRETCLRTAEIMEKTGKSLDAEEWRRKAEAVRTDKPPGFARPIGEIAQRMAGRA